MHRQTFVGQRSHCRRTFERIDTLDLRAGLEIVDHIEARQLVEKREHRRWRFGKCRARGQLGHRRHGDRQK